ncbi:hypothetical protein CDD82_2003 [Ophiocordyceps australis]|uniref:Transcription factor domain-containing protein n=1 Tax=Ophiocordyceps australis TaxID=1399860 RepID=A0A2C5Y439_9HYPO|nr:hypothetical protein CDD82_2003 [Ophiocordyceps australis]
MAPELNLGFDVDSSLGSEASPDSLDQDTDGVGVLDGDAGGQVAEPFSLADLMTGDNGVHNVWDPLSLRGYSDYDNDKVDFDLHTMPSMACAFGSQPQPQPQPQSQPQHHHQPHHQPQRQPQPVRDVEVFKSIKTMGVDVDAVQANDPNSRTGSIVAFFTSLGSKFSQTRALPFIHERLWFSHSPAAPASNDSCLPLPSNPGTSGPPPMMLAAFSAAAAYSSRTSQTTPWALRIVAEAARDVLKQGERAASHAERLARVQALTVLSVMCFFDGDIGLRAAAERGLATLLAWVKDLESVRNQLEAEARERSQLGLSMRDAPPQTWESWIFLESTRRSVTMGYAYICLSHLLKSEEPRSDMWSDQQNFTASRHLWDAKSSVEFYRAWREKPHYLIENLSFNEFWVYGRPADIDEFTRLMLTGQIGPDAMHHFMHGDIAVPVV